METPITEQESTERAQSTEWDSTTVFAGFWLRFWAYLLDLAVIWSISRIIVKPAVLLFGLSHKEILGFTASEAGWALVFYLYFLLMTKFLRQTLGKMVFGLKVISLKGDGLTWPAILFREVIGRFISKFILIGYIVTAFHPKKQGIHDLFADTSVIQEERRTVPSSINRMRTP
ncbi:RDD family protein [Peribacillus kribbensis]|uniref:RDD family protein n=1 Tax=Peribacillus kribbensis TaxID=356658 RepID=UPI000401881A|nr:RDD family protein [Peribacillus kribbensis]